MMAIFNTLRKIIAALIAIFLSFLVTSNGAEPHTVLDEENCRMCITVLSDCHVESNNLERFGGFGRILLDAQNNSFGNDVGIFLGDNTMNGQERESLFFYGLVGRESFADEYVNVMGNHDIGNGKGNYDLMAKRFYDYTREYFSIDIDKPYYYRVIDGVYFIVIGEEDLTINENYVSDEQYRFIEKTLKMADAAGAVTFICSHHPVYDIVETENYSLWEMIPKYKNIFFLSGHTHMPIDEEWTIITDRGINMLNLPRCTENMGDGDEITDETCGIGAQIEVYDDEVVIRIRNFYYGNWVEGLEQHFALEK